jgi:NhaP-type Na+/H+ or K+/H+ antiporter
VLGVAVVGAAMLPRLLARVPLSLPLVYLVVGMALFALPIGLDGPRPVADDEVSERLAEFVVIVSLMGAGLKLNRRFGWRSWSVTWRLLAVTMPLTIVVIAAMGLLPLGLPLASAVLLGAVLAPTDPVLASDVEIEGPTEEDEDDDVRFALTSEAGLNDGLAFPFTNLAIAMATATAGGWALDWVIEDVVIRLSVGLLAGWLLGRAIAWLAFRIPSRSALARTSEGFVAVGATLAIYGITEIAHGYGFLAVFVAAVTIRNEERDHEYQQILHDFAQTTERFASILFLLLLGGAIVDGALGALTPAGALVAFAIVLVVRPAAGLIGLWGERLPAAEKVAIAFFGIRGMGTVYYLAYAATEERFTAVDQIWAVAVLVIVLSIVVHGVSTTPALRYIDRRREVRDN